MSEHRSLKFTHLPLTVAIHATWDAANAAGSLRMFTDRIHAEQVLEQLPSNEADSFAPMIGALAVETGEAAVEIKGDAALSLTNGLITFERSVKSYKHVPAGPDLLGYWAPPQSREKGDGMLMWFDEHGSYHAAIVRSKLQARKILAELYWLDSIRQEHLIRHVGWWNIAEGLAEAPILIDGSIAELLNNVSITLKVMSLSSRAH